MKAAPAIVERPLRGGEGTTCSRLSARVELSLYRSLDAVESTWRDFERRSDCTAFQSFDWLAAWLLHVGSLSGVEPLVILGRSSSGQLLCIFPLAATSGATRHLNWLGSDLCDYNAPLLAPEFAGYVGNRFPDVWDQAVKLITESIKLDVIHLTKMPERVGAQTNPFLQLRVRRHPSAAYAARLGTTWEEFYASRRSLARRKADRNRMRRLAEFGEVRLVTPDAPDEIIAVLEKLFQQKSWSLARIGAADVFANPGHRNFFRELAASVPPAGFLHISRLEVGDMWAATNLGLIFRGTYYHVLCSYERRAVAPFGPGSAHLRELIQYAIESGCVCFDFTIGDEPYKLQWADEQISLYDHASAVGLRGLPAVVAIEVHRQLKRTIKQHRRLWQAYLRLRIAVAARGARRSTQGATRWSDQNPKRERRSNERAKSSRTKFRDG